MTDFASKSFRLAGRRAQPGSRQAPDLVSSLNALFARRGGPLEARLPEK